MKLAKLCSALAMVCVTSRVAADNAPEFVVRYAVSVHYPDGSSVVVTTPNVIVEGFSCEVSLTRARKGPFYGPGIECSDSGGGGFATVTRCDATQPGYASEANLTLFRADSENGDVGVRVELGCITTYTRKPTRKAPPREVRT